MAACTITHIEELKGFVRLLPVWPTGIIFSAVYGQMGNLFLLQAVYMDARLTPDFDIPEASLPIFDTLSIIFWVPIYDRLIIPAARRFTRHPNGLTQLQRIGIGLLISVFTMISTAALEVYRLSVANWGGGTGIRIDLLAGATILHHRVRRGVHQHRAAGVLLRAGAGLNAEPVCGAVAHHHRVGELLEHGAGDGGNGDQYKGREAGVDTG